MKLPLSSFEIRRLEESDLRQFCKLRRRGLQESPEAFGESVTDFDARTSGQLAELLHPHDRRDFVLGAFASDHLVGVIGFFTFSHEKLTHKGNLWGMYVESAYRNQGVGRSLLHVALTRITSIEGISHVNLSVGANNNAARRLYEAEGFTVTGREPGALKVNGHLVDEYLMQRQL